MTEKLLPLTLDEQETYANVVGSEPHTPLSKGEAGILWGRLFDVYEGDSDTQMELCKKLHRFAFMEEN